MLVGNQARQSREHIFKECKGWEMEVRALWDRVGKGAKTEEVGPSTAGKASVMISKNPELAQTQDLLGNEKFTDAVLAFLKDTKVEMVKEGILNKS